MASSGLVLAFFFWLFDYGGALTHKNGGNVTWFPSLPTPSLLGRMHCFSVSNMRRQELSQVTHMMSAVTLNNVFAVIPVTFFVVVPSLWEQQTLKSRMLMPIRIFSAFGS